MKLDILNQFETLLKQYKAAFFNKVWEHSEHHYKLIYNLQGLLVDNLYYINLKFIFWLDKEKKEISEPVITFLYSQNCEYKSETLTENNIEVVFAKILKAISQETTNQNLSNLVLSNSDHFNDEIKKNNLTDFVQNIKFIPWEFPDEAESCSNTEFKFELQTNVETYHFVIKCLKKHWLLIYNNKSIEFQFNELPKKLIEAIYATNRDNV